MLISGATKQFVNPVPLLLLGSAVAAAHGLKLGDQLNGPSFGRYDEAAGLIVAAGIARLFGAPLI